MHIPESWTALKYIWQYYRMFIVQCLGYCIFGLCGYSCSLFHWPVSLCSIWLKTGGDRQEKQKVHICQFVMMTTLGSADSWIQLLVLGFVHRCTLTTTSTRWFFLCLSKYVSALWETCHSSLKTCLNLKICFYSGIRLVKSQEPLSHCRNLTTNNL